MRFRRPIARFVMFAALVVSSALAFGGGGTTRADDPAPVPKPSDRKSVV